MATCATYNNGNVVRASAVGQINDTEAYANVYQFQLKDGGPVDFEDFADSVRDFLDDFYQDLMVYFNQVLVMQGVHVDGLAGVCSSGFLPFGANITGSLTNDAVPPGVSLVSGFPTGFKRVQLRKYYGGLDASVVDSDGNLDITFRVNVNSVLNDLVSDQVYNGLTFRFGYQSPKAGQWVEPTTRFSNTVAGYQRRRKYGVGG
jgi:hypothetical protein